MAVGEEGTGEGGDSNESQVRIGFGAIEFERRREGGDGVAVVTISGAVDAVRIRVGDGVICCIAAARKSEKLLLLGRGAGGPLNGRGSGDGDSRKAETLLLVLKGLLVRGANTGGGGGGGGGSTVNVIPTGPCALERSPSVLP